MRTSTGFDLAFSLVLTKTFSCLSDFSFFNFCFSFKAFKKFEVLSPKAEPEDIKAFCVLEIKASQEISKEIDISEKLDIDCNYLIQVNIDDDPKKSGVTKNQVFKFYEYCIEKKITVVGLMTIPDINSDPKTVFSEMHHINEKLIMDYSYKGELSMGMSNDYEVALDYGATIVRIGTKLFI